MSSRANKFAQNTHPSTATMTMNGGDVRWDRRWPLRVRSVSGDGEGNFAYTFNDKHRPDSCMGGL